MLNVIITIQVLGAREQNLKELEESYVHFQCMIVSDSNRFNVEGVSTAQYYILDTLYKQGGKNHQRTC